MLITGGVLIRTRVKEIRELGPRYARRHADSKWMTGDEAGGLEKIVETDDDEEN